MKNSRNHLVSLLLLSFVLISACNYSQKSKSENKKECDFIAKETINQWNTEFKKSAYDVYQNFNDLPFPKELIKDSPFPDNKHILFNFGLIEGTTQTYYFFAVIGDGIIGEKIELDYTTLMYFSKELNKWIHAEKELFENAKNIWKAYVNIPGSLPTLGYIAPNDDINICPHKSFDRIRFGIDLSTKDPDYQLKMYFHEESKIENPDGDDYDALVPCPPICGG